MKRHALLILLFLLFLVGSTVGLYTVLTSKRPLHVWDFQPLWRAGRWMLAGGGSPYSDELTGILQEQSYGRPAKPGEDDRAFVYPLYVLFLVLPLLPLPLPWAQAAWLTALELGVAVGAVGAMRLARWRVSTCWVFLTVVWAFLLYPVAWALVLGQVSILIFALMVVALWALQSGRDIWAGVCLALTTAKPQMSFLLVPALLVWGLAQRRYRFLLAFVSAMGILALISFVVLPTWLVETLQAGTSYFEVQPFSPPVTLLGRAIAGEGGRAVTLALALALLAGLAWTWWRGWRVGGLPVSAIAMTLVVTALVAPRTSVVNQAPLLLPLCLLFADLTRQGRWGAVAASVLQAVLLVGLWAMDLLWFPSLSSGEHWHAQQQVISPALPVLLLVGLMARPLWGRRKRPL